MKQQKSRKSGELAFAGFLCIASLILFYNAYLISGFEALSAPGAIPMATTLVMMVTAVLIAYQTRKAAPDPASTFGAAILPVRVVVVTILLIAYAFALKPLGFLPTSAVFLVVAIKYLGRSSWVYSIGIGLICLLVIYLLFRIVFTVLMPAGIVPEGEMLAWVRNLFAGAR